MKEAKRLTYSELNSILNCNNLIDPQQYAENPTALLEKIFSESKHNQAL